MVDTSNLFSSLKDLCAVLINMSLYRETSISLMSFGDLAHQKLLMQLLTLWLSSMKYLICLNSSQGDKRKYSVLHIILTTESLRYQNCSIETPFSLFVHNAIVCSISCSDSIRTAVYQRHATSKKINYVALEHESLTIDWSAASYPTCDVNALWNSFQVTLSNALTRCTSY